MPETQLSSELKHSLARFLTGRPEILFAVLYGSAAEGRAFRDLDVAVFVDRAPVAAWSSSVSARMWFCAPSSIKSGLRPPLGSVRR